MVPDAVAPGGDPWAPVAANTWAAEGAPAAAGTTMQRAGLSTPNVVVIVIVMPADMALTVGCATTPAVNDTLSLSSSACAQYLEE